MITRRRSGSNSADGRRVSRAQTAFESPAPPEVFVWALSSAAEKPKQPMHQSGLPTPSLAYSCWSVHTQEAHGNPARRCQCKDFAIADLIVLIPPINPRMKQARQMSSFGINRRDVAPFKSIADSATQSEILSGCLAAMFNRNDVIYLMFGQRQLIGDSAIFA